MISNIKTLLVCGVGLLPIEVSSKIWNDSLCYHTELSTTVSPQGVTPLWMSSNKHGLSTLQENSAYLRVGITQSNFNIHSSKPWTLGYGVDVVLPVNYATENVDYGKQRSNFILQQAYVDLNYKKVCLSVGAKERPMMLKNNQLSSGSQTFGINARPVLQVRFELPEYLSLTGKESAWLAIKGHLGYGMMTDGSWQKSYASKAGRCAENTLLHTKAGYLRIGDPSKHMFIFEGGLEMATQFGGTIYNPTGRTGWFGEKIEMGTKPSDFIDAILGTGSDETDGAYQNASGNTLGSWLFSLKYQAQDWSLRAYYDHFFEDHSMMFFEYGWFDGMMGLEINMPKNKWLTTLVYEYMNTTYQAGAVYHDKTPQIPDQVSARDNYYNHNLYPGWQHWGYAMGNPLFTSPVYYSDSEIAFHSNRFKAHHFAFQGQMIEGLNYHVKLSYATHLGTYWKPYLERRYMTSGLLALNYNFEHLKSLSRKGWESTFTFAFDRGKQLGDNLGFSISLIKKGLFLNKK
ncbi:MAG: hypothetical protein J6R79_05450 [Bacteroidaceae bacterium]|nr:hypothetical protein [Bacteroidaceae bacterium]